MYNPYQLMYGGIILSVISTIIIIYLSILIRKREKVIIPKSTKWKTDKKLELYYMLQYFSICLLVGSIWFFTSILKYIASNKTNECQKLSQSNKCHLALYKKQYSKSHIVNIYEKAISYLLSHPFSLLFVHQETSLKKQQQISNSITSNLSFQIVLSPILQTLEYQKITENNSILYNSKTEYKKHTPQITISFLSTDTNLFYHHTIDSFSIHPQDESFVMLKPLWVSLSSKAQLLGCVFDTPDRDALPITYGGAL